MPWNGPLICRRRARRSSRRAHFYSRWFYCGWPSLIIAMHFLPERSHCARLILDKRFKSRERVVPLSGDEVEVVFHFFERLRIKLEEVFAACADAVDDFCALENAEMFGDGLARESRAMGQLRDGTRLAAAELGDEYQPCFVAKSCEDARGSAASCGGSATVSLRHSSRCSLSAASSRDHSCGGRPVGVRRGLFQSRIR